MSPAFADALFWVAAAAIGAAQAVILRSTWRGMRQGIGSTHPVREWTFAAAPAFVLLLLMLATYQAMHPGVLRSLRARAAGATAGATSTASPSGPRA